MIETYSFGEWLKQQRKLLRLTQREVAEAAFCSTAMIKKIEADERQPSPELAASLAEVINFPQENLDAFIEAARGERPIDTLKTVTKPNSPTPDSQLPIPATRFIGRSNELTAVTDLLRQIDVRLVTLLGPGGIGKTRLAIEVAGQIQNNYRDGVIFVPLAAVNDPQAVPQAIAQAMRLPLVGDDTPAGQIKQILSRRQTLLVLDNFEQLTEDVPVLPEILTAAPGVKLLVTSRERLNLAGEWLFPMPELKEAANLFGQTAVRLKPDFDSGEEEPAVNHICQLLGRHPLAIELAASWIRFMSCSQIADQIQKDLGFLNLAPRNAPERHKSIRALFDHSWQLLTTAEQIALARLSVFRGGFAPEQAASVAGADWPILLGLVDKSLVETPGDNRFDLHELTRQYASVKLEEMGETFAACSAHFAAYTAQSVQISDWFTTRKSALNFRQAQQEQNNFRAAFQWGLENKPAETLLEMAHHLFVYWLRSGHWREGEEWIKKAVARAGSSDSFYLCLALAHMGTFTALQGRFSEAFPITSRSYEMARRLEEPWPMVVTLQIRGQSLRDKAEALAAFDEAIAICKVHEGEPQFDAFFSSLMGLRGDRLMGFGMIEEAKASYETSLTYLRTQGDTYWIAYPLGNLGRMALQAGDLKKAYQLINESVTIARKSGNRVGIADWIFRLGQVLLYQGALDKAELNLQETLQLYEDVGNKFGPPGVLSNLALVALEKEDLETAVSRFRECMNRYIQLQRSVSEADLSSDFMEFGDTIDSLLHGGLIAYAQGDSPKAIAFFEFFAQNVKGYVPIQPLQQKVTAVQQEIQAELLPEAYETAVIRGKTLELTDLITMWLPQNQVINKS